MKQFSIHKVNKPVMQGKSKVGGYGADEEADISKLGADGEGTGYGYNGQEQPSLLSVEEQEALQPKEIKVVNPWIHEATHKEYLENVKVGIYHSTYVLFKYYSNSCILNNLNLGFAGETCKRN